MFGRGVDLAYGRFRVASHRSEPRSAPSQRACLANFVVTARRGMARPGRVLIKLLGGVHSVADWLRIADQRPTPGVVVPQTYIDSSRSQG